MIATETRSTSPSSSKLLKSTPPPKSQMSLPGCFFSAETVCEGLSETVTPRQSGCLSVREKRRTRCLASIRPGGSASSRTSFAP
jgi:hypothetical protein